METQEDLFNTYEEENTDTFDCFKTNKLKYKPWNRGKYLQHS